MQFVASINNLVLDRLDTININQCFEIRNDMNQEKILIGYNASSDNNFIESYQSYFRRAIELALPNILISPRCILDEGNNKFFWKSSVFVSYFGNSNYENKTVYRINTQDIINIKTWHNLLIKYHKNYSDNKGPVYFYWDIAYNEYLSGLYCSFLEEAIVHLITAIEALVITGDYKISYRTALYASLLNSNNAEEQGEIFNLIKELYNLRSKVVHGDDKALKNKFKDIELYDKMFRLRKIVSNLLYITYSKNKKDIIKDINKLIASKQIKVSF